MRKGASMNGTELRLIQLEEELKRQVARLEKKLEELEVRLARRLADLENEKYTSAVCKKAQNG